MGQPGCVGSRVREKPRSALAARCLFDRTSGAVPVRGPLRPGFSPAPPDDPATEALSPVPQWPDNRLIVPVEANGYLTMLERWQQERLDAEARLGPTANFPGEPRSNTPATPPAAPPSPSPTPSPFAPGSGAPRPPAAGAGPAPHRSAAPGNSPPPQNAAPIPPAPSGPGASTGGGIPVQIPGQTRRVRRRFW